MATKKQRYIRKPFLTSLVLCTVLLLAVASILLPSSKTTQVQAATSSTLNFQARLFNASGSTVADGTYNIEFKIYDSLAAGASNQGVCVGGATDDCQWMETRTGANKVTAKNGYFSVNLGSVTALPNINWDQDLYITMNIGGTGTPTWDGEMSPRIKLTSVPYALDSGKLDGIDSTGFAQLGPSAVQGVNSANNAVRINQTGAGDLLQLQGSGLDVLTLDKTGILTLGTSNGASGNTGKIVLANSANNNTVTIQSGSTTTSYILTFPLTVGSANECLKNSGTPGVLTFGGCGAASSGVDTIGAIDSQTKSANGAVISGTTLYLQTADGTYPGLVSTGTQTFAGAKTFTGATTIRNATATAFVIQNASSENSLVFDGSTKRLRVYDNVASPTAYAELYYASGEAVFAASSGTTRIGNGSGDVTISTTAVADDLAYTHTGTASAAYTGTDATITRSLTGSANALGGSVFKITDTSTANAGIAINPTMLLINQAATGGTISGNLIDAQLAGASRFSVTTAGNGSFAGTLGVTGAATFSANLTVNGSQFTNAGSTLNTANALGNFATGGSIGSAATTVDVDTSFTIAQTTAGQTLSLPSPTTTTAGRIVYVANTGTASFVMHSVTIASGSAQAYIWNGSAWTATSVDGAGNGVTGVGTIDSQTKSANGAVISGSSIYLQTADGTYPGLVSTGSQTFAGAKTFSGALTVTGLGTFNGGLTVATGSTFTNASSSLFTALAISDRATGGNIGTAATTVDVATTFNVNQTTAGQTLSLPSPTTTTAGRIVYVANTGTASFVMHSVTIAAGSAQQYIWNGSAWTAANIDGAGGGGGVTTVGTFSASSQTNGATISGSTITFGPADGTNPGMVSTGSQTFAGTKTFSGAVTIQAANSLTLGTAGPSGNTGSILLRNSTNANTVTLQSGATSATYSLTLPTAVGAANECLKNSGTAGILTFAACGSSGITTTLQDAYNNSATPALITTADGKNIRISLQDTATDQTLEITQAGTADALRVNDDGTFTDTTPFVIDASGNVGVGTAAPAYKLELSTNDSAAVQLNIKNTYATANASGGANIRFDNGVDNSSIGIANSNRTAYGALTAGSTALYSSNSAGIVLMSDNATSSIRFAAGNSSEKMRIDSNGNVGIGDTTPAYLLTVGSGDLFGVNSSGNVIVTALGAAGTTAVCRNASNQLSSCSGAGANTLQGAYDGGNTITTTDARNISITLADTATDQTLEITQAGTADALRVNDDGTFTDTTPFVIDANGNVGIGTAAPGYKLDVNSSSVRFGDGGSLNVRLAVPNGSTVRTNFMRDSDGVALMTLQGDGKVGIGTTNPDDKLQVLDGVASVKASQPQFYLRDTQASGKIWGTASGLSAVGNYDIRNFSDAITAISIQPSGNVGIGTASPGEKLEIQGNIQVGNANVATVGEKLTRTSGGIAAILHTYIPSNNSPHYQTLYGGTWSGELTGSTLVTQAFYVDTAANAFYRIGRVTTAGAFTSANLTNDLYIDPAGVVAIGTSTIGANGLLQVNGDIGLAGARTIRSASNADTDTLRYLGTQLVIGHLNSTAYSYTGGGLIASKSASDGQLLFDVGRNTGSAAFKLTNTTSSEMSLNLTNNAGSSVLFASTNNGNVGIGTAAPIDKLQVTADNSILGSGEFMGANLVYNGGGEDGSINGWTSRDFGIDGSAGSGSVSTLATFSGGYSFLATQDGGLNQQITVVPGATYTLSLRMRVVTQGAGDAAQGYLVVGTTATGRDVVDQTCNPNTYDTTPNTNKWVLCSATFAAPAATDVATTTVYVGFRAMAATHSVYVDNVSLVRGGLASSYNPITTFADSNGATSISGNVGIGTTNPGARLEVSNSTASATTNQLIIKNTNTGAGTYSAGIMFSSYSGSGQQNSARIYSVFDGDAYDMQRLSLQTTTAAGDSTLRDVLSLRGGKVGIGTASPQENLHVVGSFRVDPGQIIFGGATNSQIIGGSTVQSGDVDDINFLTNGSNRVTIKDGGNVGIGTTGPDSKLHIVGGGICIENTDSGCASASGDLTVKGGDLTLGTAGASGIDGKIILQNAANANTVTIMTGTTGTSYNLILPTTAGASGECVKNTGTAGILTFAACGSTGITTTLQDAYNNSTSPALITTVDGKNIRISLQDAATDQTFEILQAGVANALRINTPTTADSLAQVIISTGATTNKGLVVQGVAFQSADLLQAQNSTGAVRTSISSLGHITVRSNTTAASGDNAFFRAVQGVNDGRAFVAQTTDPNNSGAGFDLVDASGNTMSRIITNRFQSSAVGGSLPPDAQFSALLGTNSYPGIILKRNTVAGNTSDMIQLQDETGAIITRFDSSGYLRGANGATGGAGSAGLAVTIQGGDAGGTGANNGGNVVINGGAKTGAGTVGHVILQGTNGGNVGIGTSTFGTNNRLLVNPYSTVDNWATAQISTSAAANRGLVIQGFASQTSDLLQVQNSSGQMIASISSSGTITANSPGVGGISIQAPGTINADSGGLSIAAFGSVYLEPNGSSATTAEFSNAGFSISTAANGFAGPVLQVTAAEAGRNMATFKSDATTLNITNNTTGVVISSTWNVSSYTPLSRPLSFKVGAADGYGDVEALRLIPVSYNITQVAQAAADDGTVSNPGFTTINDTDTGIYFPAADVLAVTTAGTERLRVNASGNTSITGDILQASNGVNALGDSESMVPNAGFEVNDDATTTVADNWTFTQTTGTPTAAVTTTSPGQGERSQQITSAATTDIGTLTSACVPVSESQSYTLTPRIKGSVAATSALTTRMVTYTTKANCVAQTSGTNVAGVTGVTLTTAWTSTGYTAAVTAGAGATWARVAILLDSPGTAATTMNIDSVRLTPTAINTGVDLAENFPALASDNLVPGEVVSFGAPAPEGGSYAVRSTAPYDSKVFGVVSTQPGLTLDDGKGYERVAVALAGRVPVKVTNQNGAIATGDPITASSVPGVGMKATTTGRIIGYAVTTFDGEGQGEIIVLITPSFWAPAMNQTLQAQAANFGSLQVSGTAMLANLNVSGQSTLANLKVTGDAEVQGTLKVTNLVVKESLTVEGHIVSRGTTPQAVLGAASGSGNGMDASSGPQITLSGTDSAGTVTVKTGTINPSNGELAEITFHQAYDVPPKIVISGNNSKSAKLGAYIVRTATGFKIMTDDQVQAGTTYEFDYIIIAAKTP